MTLAAIPELRWRHAVVLEFTPRTRLCICFVARASAAPRPRQRKASDGSRLERRALKSQK